jgi:hypothetical protein
MFDLLCTSPGPTFTLRLKASNRKARELLLLALGVANFTGWLADLTPQANLFPAQGTKGVTDIMASAPAGAAGVEPESGLAVNPDQQQQLESMHHLLKSNMAIAKLQRELVAAEKGFGSAQESDRR